MTTLPLALLDQHAAIVGKTGSGKTFAAKGMVERLLDAGRRVCIVDPTGVWWGSDPRAMARRRALELRHRDAAQQSTDRRARHGDSRRRHFQEQPMKTSQLNRGAILLYALSDLEAVRADLKKTKPPEGYVQRILSIGVENRENERLTDGSSSGCTVDLDLATAKPVLDFIERLVRDELRKLGVQVTP